MAAETWLDAADALELGLADKVIEPVRIPQMSFEVFHPLADPDTAEGLTQAVTMIPASGEFAYATQGIRKGSSGSSEPENLNALTDTADMVVALDRLQAMAPKVESVSLVVAWFGDDLRAGNCQVRPGVEVTAKSTTPSTWSVNGVSRANAFLVSRDDQDRPVYGGTPSDFAVVQAIQEMKARGLRVTFYPFILMDVPPGNTLPNPYSDNAAEAGQPAFPWRGRITCSPAAGYAGTVDKTATAATQVAALFGAAIPASFSVSGQSVSWTGPSGDWGLRRMVLHYAHLCAAAGGVDAFLIGTEMPGLRVISSIRIEVILTGNPAQCLDPITTIRNDDIVANLHISPKREGAHDVSVMAAGVASSATRALNSGEWFFRFFILDHFFHHAIHLNNWSEFLRPPLRSACCVCRSNWPSTGF